MLAVIAEDNRFILRGTSKERQRTMVEFRDTDISSDTCKGLVLFSQASPTIGNEAMGDRQRE